MAQINTTRVKMPKGWQPPPSAALDLQPAPKVPDTFDLMWYARIWLAMQIAWKAVWASDADLDILRKWLIND